MYSAHSRSLGFLLLFSRRFLLEHFMIHFELTFAECRVCVQINSFWWGTCTCSSTILLTRVSATLYCLCSFIKDYLTVFTGVCFWAVCSIYQFTCSLTSTTLQHLFDKSQSKPCFWLWEELQAVPSLSFSSRVGDEVGGELQDFSSCLGKDLLCFVFGFPVCCRLLLL